jgi:hypothetical protein
MREKVVVPPHEVMKGGIFVCERQAMTQYVYLDTNAFRYFGIAFRNVPLAEELRNRILISPLSAFEIFGQLADENDGSNVLSQIQAVRNWTNRHHCGLLPWPTEMLHQLWFQRPIQDNEFTKQMEVSLNICLTADSVESVRAEAVKHKQVMDRFKEQAAQAFKRMLDAARAERRKTVNMTDAWFHGIATRARADPNSRPVPEIVATLNAYYEFEKSRLERALADAGYNPLSPRNLNDAIDSEQLVYLGDPMLRMLTSDRGFKGKLAQSTQRSRIVIVPPGDLMDAQRAAHVLRCSSAA